MIYGRRTTSDTWDDARGYSNGAQSSHGARRLCRKNETSGVLGWTEFKKGLKLSSQRLLGSVQAFSLRRRELRSRFSA